MITKAIRRFIAKESSSGIVLMTMAVLALFLANTSFNGIYFLLLESKVAIGGLNLSVQHWINDALMALFFLLVGLEMKREMMQGELSTRAQALLPMLAAAGGIVVPMLVYSIVTAGHAELAQGWAVPAATDIAFALGVLMLLGSRVPLSVKVFLTALAIVDDLAAVLIIGLFYSANIDWQMLGAALGIMAVLVAMNLRNITSLVPYLLIGVALWFCVFHSGLHATLAGVMLALVIPLHPVDFAGRAETHMMRRHSPLRRLEHLLHPFVVYGVLPVFALANAGLELRGLTLASLAQPLPLGIALGLFIGKQIGIFGAAYSAIKYGVAPMPAGATTRHLYGAAVLGGIGFTMSLFIGALAFPDTAHANLVKLGVMTGSVASAALGYAILRRK